MPFINFDDLLCAIEDLVIDTVTRALELPGVKEAMEILNPTFKIPSKPFKRMRYEEAIEWLAKEGIVNEETGKAYVFGEVPKCYTIAAITEPDLLIGYSRKPRTQNDR